MALSADELREIAIKNAETENVFVADCDNVIFLLDNCEITVPNDNRFFVKVNTNNIQRSVWEKRISSYGCIHEEAGLADGNEAMAYTGTYDFGHTTTQWEAVIELGIWGLRQRIDKYAEAKNSEFYQNLSRVYDAALRFMKRAAKEAFECGKTEMAQGLLNLTENPPQTMYEAMQTSLVYYTLQQHFDNTILRTLGRLDKLFYPYYLKCNKSEAEQLVRDFIIEIDRMRAVSNMAFAIGGTDKDGNDLFNELSYMFVDVYTKLEVPHTKFHFLYSDNTTDDIIKKAFISVRDGHNSIVFMSDNKIIESLKKLGADHEDAVNYHVVGCYECGSEDELTCSCNARVNIQKAVEYTLTGGIDMVTGKSIGLPNNGVFNTFEELYNEFVRQLQYLCLGAMKSTDLYEANYSKFHSSPILSGVYKSAMEKGADLYCDNSAKYCNSSVNGVGLGTAVDSLWAIKKLVYTDKTLTLDQLTNILNSDWEGYEWLRLTAKNKFCKFGINHPETNELAKDIVDVLSNSINNKPNAKGGVYRLGLFSIDWRWQMGGKTGASADGRRKGETLSQNTSATFGADREGATAHLLSVASIDASNVPNGAIVDIDLHSSAAQGENGINVLVSTLKTFFDLGGFSVHYNVLDTEVLKDAKLNPEKYPNLQVRLCGWNVLFSSLSDKEKDEFIARSVK